MEHADLIIQIAAVLSALGVIIGAAIKVWKTVKAFNAKISAVLDTVEDLKTHSNENYMSLLRLTIMSSEMPIGERIVAGQKYLDAGGNGEVKKFLQNEFNITDAVSNASHYKK